MVVKLWDRIVFQLSHASAEMHKYARWYILAPAYMILSKKKDSIKVAKTCEDLCRIFEDGCSLWYDPLLFFKELE